MKTNRILLLFLLLLLAPFHAYAAAPTVGTLKPSGLVANGAPYRASASSVLTLPTKGMLNGLVNPNGDSCTVSFDYGPTTAYGSSASYGTVSGTSSVAVSSQMYFTWVTDGSDQSLHYRTKVVCSGTTWYGNDVTFVPFTSTVRSNYNLEPDNASFPTANIHNVPTCSDSATLATFDMKNWNNYDVTLDYTAGTDHGSVVIGSFQVQQVFVGKGSIAAFYYNYTLFEQILTNDRLCSEPQSPSSLVRGYALGNPGGVGQIYTLYNDNSAPITLDVMAGSDIFSVTIPARSRKLIATALAEAQFSYNSAPFMILSPLGGVFWADRYLVTAAPVSSTVATSDFLLRNNDDAAHTAVLRNGAGTEHRYTLPPYGSQTVTVEYGNWDLYLVVPDMVGPAMVGDHVKVASLNPGLIPQTISFGAAPAMAVGGANGTVSATATSGLAVTFSSLTPSVCTVSGATVTAVTAGTCTIAADQTGNGSYAPALQVSQSFPVSGKPAFAYTNFPGLISMWAGGGNAVDSISGNNGALQGSATYAAGYAGQGFSFDGTAGGYVSIPDSSSLHPAQYSASAWFNWGDIGTGNIQFLMGKGVERFEIHTGSNNSIRFIPAGYPSSYVDSPANAIQTGWNHIAVTYGSGEAKIYMNGALVASRSSISGAADLTTATAPLVFGGRSDASYYFKGGIDEVGLFNRVLSASEVSSIFTNSATGFTLAASAVPGATGAVISGSVNDNMADTTVSVEYGLTSGYGMSTTATPATITAGSGMTPVTATLTGLQACATTYHYRLKATNAVGTSVSGDQNFSTLPCQSISFGPAPDIITGTTGTVSATGGPSGNPVIFSSLTPSICTISGSTVTAIAAGTCTIAANQAGNSSYGAAPQVTQSFSINKDQSSNVTSIVFDTAAPATLYAAIDGEGIHKSTDSGASWTKLAVQPGNLRVKALLFNPTTPGSLYTVTYGSGIWKSSDSGASWSACTNGAAASFYAFSLAIDPAGILYAGTEGGIFTSTNGCTSWSAVNSGLTVDAAKPPVVITVDGSSLYAGLDGLGVWKKVDTGNWEDKSSGLPANSRVKGIVKGATNLYAAIYGSGVYRSSDSGASWISCSGQPANLNILSLQIDGSGYLYAGTEDGVFVSEDGCGSWTAMNNGLPN